MSELASIIAKLADVLKDLQALQGSIPVNRQSDTVQIAESTGTFDDSYSFVETSTCSLGTGEASTCSLGTGDASTCSLGTGDASTVKNTIIMPKIISKHDVAGLDKKLEEYKRESDKAVADAQPKIPYQEVKLDKDSIEQKVEEYKRDLCQKA